MHRNLETSSNRVGWCISYNICQGTSLGLGVFHCAGNLGALGISVQSIAHVAS